MQRVLSFEQTPPLSAPLRFFLTAPLFAALAGALLAWLGPDAFASRWTPAALALTHLLTLGFLAMSMIGALLQILPVVVGVDVAMVRLTGSAVHALLTLGALALSTAFWLSMPALFWLALPLLISAFVWLLAACACGLWRTAGSGATLAAIRLALAALAIAVGLGAAAASGFAWPLALPLIELTRLHAAWGLLGWVGLLVIGVAFQVVPMFQVTPVYPVWITRRLAWSVFLPLVLWSAVAAIAPRWAAWAALPACAGLVAFCIVTLYLLRHRKRPKPEATTLFWYAGLVSLLACAALWLAGELLPGVGAAPSYPFALGILFIVGFGYSIINGMLYKIVPFLVWYHLQGRLAGGCVKAPNVKQILPDGAAARQFRAHLLALILLLGASAWPNLLVHPAAAAFIVSSCWLWINLASAMRMYRRTLRHDAKHQGALSAPA